MTTLHESSPRLKPGVFPLHPIWVTQLRTYAIRKPIPYLFLRIPTDSRPNGIERGFRRAPV
jgi:hypothetical protein